MKLAIGLMLVGAALCLNSYNCFKQDAIIGFSLEYDHDFSETAGSQSVILWYSNPMEGDTYDAETPRNGDHGLLLEIAFEGTKHCGGFTELMDLASTKLVVYDAKEGEWISRFDCDVSIPIPEMMIVGSGTIERNDDEEITVCTDCLITITAEYAALDNFNSMIPQGFLDFDAHELTVWKTEFTQEAEELAEGEEGEEIEKIWTPIAYTDITFTDETSGWRPVKTTTSMNGSPNWALELKDDGLGFMEVQLHFFGLFQNAEDAVVPIFALDEGKELKMAFKFDQDDSEQMVAASILVSDSGVFSIDASSTLVPEDPDYVHDYWCELDYHKHWRCSFVIGLDSINPASWQSQDINNPSNWGITFVPPAAATAHTDLTVPTFLPLPNAGPQYLSQDTCGYTSTWNLTQSEYGVFTGDGGYREPLREMSFMDTEQLPCGFCEMSITLQLKEKKGEATQNLIEPQDFFIIACSQFAEDGNQMPMDGDEGIAAIGRTSEDNLNMEDWYIGPYKLEDAEEEGDLKYNFHAHETNFVSKKTSEVKAHTRTELTLSTILENGWLKAWDREGRFYCHSYLSPVPFPQEIHMSDMDQTTSGFEVSFHSCLTLVTGEDGDDIIDFA